ncbi:MAG: hypothetical protein JKY48_05505 [Flavobacteriales bacterium]|nr:hypothetical protein [Flavobacteriales bacterium]
MNIYFENKKNYSIAQKSKVSVITASCPNCWGHNEWDGKYYEALKDRHLKRNIYKSFISKIVDQYVIRVYKRENKYICKNCDQGVAA